MGFWDVRRAALEAIGEVFSTEEIRVLEEGGTVIHLHPLQTPDVETRDWCTYPDRNEVVVIPELLDCLSVYEQPAEIHQNSWGSKKHRFPSVASYMDDNFGWRGHRSDWTDYPRYCGEMSHQVPHTICDMRCEDIIACAYWNCWPVQRGQEHLATQIVTAGERFLDNALYWELEWLCRIAYDGEYDYSDPWLYYFHRDLMPKEDAEAFENAIVYLEGHHAAAESIEIQARQFQALYKAHVIDFEPGNNRHQAVLAHGEQLQWLPFGDLAADLEFNRCYAAADLYRQMIARRRASLARLPRFTNHRGHVENEVED